MVEVHVAEVVRGVERLVEDCAEEPGFAGLPVRDQLERLARRLHRAHQEGDAAAAVCVGCWHPKLVGAPVAEIMAADLSLDDTRETVAREHGFAGWADADATATAPHDPDFERAVDAVVHGELEELRALLAARPELATQRSAFGHRATLLHYVGSNGVETHRQKAPSNLAQITQALLDAGAEVDAPAGMYGGGITTLALVLTSAHPAEAGVADAVVQVLVEAGAARE